MQNIGKHDKKKIGLAPGERKKYTTDNLASESREAQQMQYLK